MNGDFSYICDLYKYISMADTLGEDFCVAFVYNTAEKIRDVVHASECVYPEERDMIVNSFREKVKYVYPFDSEIAFANEIQRLKARHKHILVYSMAQNINGIGRRCLVPLLCDYYNLINIGAGTMACIYGGSKYLMYEMLRSIPDIHFPKTYYVLSKDNIPETLKHIRKGKWLLKPNDESASIGIEIFESSKYSDLLLEAKLIEYHKQFPIFCVQEYIEGAEVAVPLLWYNGKYYCPGISEVVFQQGREYLDYDTVALGNCSYQEYTGSLSTKLIRDSICVAERLCYRAISRIDFRIKNGIGYIEDIGPNPTISEENGVNELFRVRLGAQSSCVYQLLLYTALEHNGLFKPPLNYSPKDWQAKECRI